MRNLPGHGAPPVLRVIVPLLLLQCLLSLRLQRSLWPWRMQLP